MNDIQIFNNPDFGEIRTVILNGEPWFVAKDIAGKLGYAKTFSMTKQIDEEDKKIFDCSSQEDANFSTKARNVGIINESGLYSAIMGSQLKTAKAFKRWVTKDILPTIRKTGTYGQLQLPQTTGEKIALLAQGHVEMSNRIEEVSGEVKTVRQEIQDLKDDLPLFPSEADKIKNAVNQRVVLILGGKNSNAYKDKGFRRKVFINCYQNLKGNFEVGKYTEIKRKYRHEAIKIVERYEPPFFLAEQIANINAQQSLNLEGGVENV